MAGERILLLEDPEGAAELSFDEALRARGYHTLIARDTDECLHMGLWEDPDLIVVSARYLDDASLDTHRTIKTWLPHVPVLMISADGSAESVEEAMRQGVADCLVQPADPGAVEAAISRVLTERAGAEEFAEEWGAPQELATPQWQVAQRKPFRKASDVHIIGRALVATLDLEAVQTRIVEAVTYLTLAPRAYLLLRDAESGEMHQVARRDRGDKYARTLREAVKDDVAAEAMRSGTPKLLRASQDAIGARHRLDVPLLSAESPIGVLSVLSDDDTRPFTDHDQFLLEQLAQYAVVALENARLVNGLLSAYEELRKPAEKAASVSADRPLSVVEVGAGASAEKKEGAAEKEKDFPEPGAVDHSQKEEDTMAEVKVGTISHYYGKLGVAIVDLEATLSVGDTVHIVGHTSDFTQEVASMQIEHEDLEEAKAGQSIGLKVDQRTRQNDEVLLVS